MGLLDRGTAVLSGDTLVLLVSLTATPPSICCSTFSLALIFIRGGGQPCRSFWFSGAAYTRLCMVRHYGHRTDPARRPTRRAADGAARHYACSGFLESRLCLQTLHRESNLPDAPVPHSVCSNTLYYQWKSPRNSITIRLSLDAVRRLSLVVERRSEEHTSELQSHHDLVCRLLLEKKK